jgi:hypothetical protein
VASPFSSKAENAFAISASGAYHLRAVLSQRRPAAFAISLLFEVNVKKTILSEPHSWVVQVVNLRALQARKFPHASITRTTISQREAASLERCSLRLGSG